MRKRVHLLFAALLLVFTGAVQAPHAQAAAPAKVYLDGNWNMSFENWTFDYLVYSWLTALMWVLIIIGIPILIGVIWWLNKEMKKKPQTRIDSDFGQ